MAINDLLPRLSLELDEQVSEYKSRLNLSCRFGGDYFPFLVELLLNPGAGSMSGR